jgi:hypothetical protein
MPLLQSSLIVPGRSPSRKLKLALIALCLIFSTGTATLELSWGSEFNDQSNYSAEVAAR